MKIYTKTGDKGQTSLIGGRRVAKDSPQIEAYGTVDELNAFVGVAATAGITDDQDKKLLLEIQSRLFDMGAVLALDPEKASTVKLRGILPADIESLERAIDRIQSKLPELKNFVLPAGSPAVCAIHVARAVCRRCERTVVYALEDTADNDLSSVKIYLNRLSDYLFSLARKTALDDHCEEVFWSNDIEPA